MKAKRQIAKNYAQALIELMGDHLEVKENALIQLKELNAAISQVKNASLVFQSPVIAKTEKKELIKQIFSKDTNNSKIITNFIFLLIDNHRFSLLPDIQEEVERLIDKQKGLVSAEVTSAKPLQGDDIENVRKILEATLLKQNQRLKIEQKTEPTLIGGLKVKINDLVYDGSIKSRLEELKRRLG